MRFTYLVLACLPVLGQTSNVSSVSKVPGEMVTLEISAASQPSRAPVTLKWEVVFPVQLMEMEDSAPELGNAATDSAKSIECTARRPYIYACTLSGGQKPIGNGLIARYRFKIRTTAAAGTTTLKIERAVATTVDSKVATLNDTEVIVIIK
jgi:hypothetical protein